MPAFMLPQIPLAGLIVPRERMARALELVSDFLPLTYAYDALARATADDVGAHLAFESPSSAAPSSSLSSWGDDVAARRTA